MEIVNLYVSLYYYNKVYLILCTYNQNSNIQNNNVLYIDLKKFQRSL